MKKTVLCRLIALLLLIVMTAGFAACGTAGGNENASSEATTASGDVTQEETEETGPVFRDEDYGGTTFTLYARSTSVASYNTVYMMAPEMTGDLMEDAVYKRNVAVEEKYKIRFEMIEATNPYKDLPQRGMTSDDQIDLMFDQRRYMGSLITGGYLTDMMQYSEIMNFEALYWDANAYNEYQVCGKLFMMPNDVSTQNLAGVRFLYFNKNLLDNNHLTSPYDYVENHDWTIENFSKLAASCCSDLNGDGIYNTNDIVGVVYDNTMIRNMISGCGVKFTEPTADGGLVPAFGSERAEQAVSALRAGLYEKQYAVTYDNYVRGADQSGYATKYIFSASQFAEDKFLFIYWGLNCTDLLRDMKGDYGVAPNPMLNKDQERYYHRQDGYVPIFTIPSCVKDKERTAVILEYWAYESSQTVFPTYYDVTIKNRRVPDVNCGNMLDLIKGSIRYEISEECQNFGIDDVLNQAYDQGTFASLVRGNEKAVNSKIKVFVDAILALDK